MTAAQIRAAVTDRLTTTAGAQTLVGPNAQWIWRHGHMQATLDVYTTGAVGFWCQLGTGPEVRLIGQGLTVAQVLGALDLATAANALTRNTEPAAGDGGIWLTAEQLAAWVGRPLSPAEVDRLDDAVPNSSIPDAIGTIVASFTDPDEESP